MNRFSLLLRNFLMMGIWLCGYVGIAAGDSQSLSNAALIQPGESVAIEVEGYTEFNTTSPVLQNGTIFIPLVGDIQAAGLTEAQFQDQLRISLSEYINGDIGLTTTIIRGVSASPSAPPDQDAFVSVSRVPPEPVQMPPTPMGAYIMQPKDRIDLSVWGYPEFKTTAIVAHDGMIDVPLIGDMPAAGLTEAQLQNQLRISLSEYIKGDINLSTTVTRPQTSDTRPQTSVTRPQSEIINTTKSDKMITVLGTIGRQDSYEVANALPLFELLSMAGGTMPESDLQHITIVSMTQGTREVNFNKAIKGGPSSMPVVYPGDTVFIPQKKHHARLIWGAFTAALTTTTSVLLLLRFF